MFPFGINGAGSFRNRDRSDSDSLKNVQNRETFSGMALAADGRQNLNLKHLFIFSIVYVIRLMTLRSVPGQV